MKIRWNESSIRFRITPAELGALQNGRPVSQALALPTGVAWSTRIAPGAAASQLVFEAGVLQLHLGAHDLAELGNPESEGVYMREGDLRFFIEKDFPCAHPRAGEADEPPTETFAPPSGFEERKTKI